MIGERKKKNSCWTARSYTALMHRPVCLVSIPVSRSTLYSRATFANSTFASSSRPLSSTTLNLVSSLIARDGLINSGIGIASIDSTSTRLINLAIVYSTSSNANLGSSSGSNNNSTAWIVPAAIVVSIHRDFAIATMPNFLSHALSTFCFSSTTCFVADSSR